MKTIYFCRREILLTYVFQKRSGSLMGTSRAVKSDSVRRHRDSSLSDASEGGLRTPGSKNTVSPGSTRSPKEVSFNRVKYLRPC